MRTRREWSAPQCTAQLIPASIVAKGAAVTSNDVIGIVETDKVNVDLRAPVTGYVLEWMAKEGETITTGNTLATFKIGALPGSRASCFGH